MIGGINTTLGFVLIKTNPGRELWVHGRLLNEPEIREVYPIFGEYDFLIKIVTTDIHSLGNTVINKIRIIDGVLDTVTLTEMKIPGIK